MQLLKDLRRALPYDVVPVTPENYTIAREVYATNPGYFQFFGKLADDESILSAMLSVPDGFNIEDKFYAALCLDGKAIAIIDLLAGYPNKGDLWLGLLLVHGNMHGKGLGAIITNGVVQGAKWAGFDNLRLGVIEANTDAVRFWEKMGFVRERTSGDVLVFKRSVHESL